MKRLTLIFLAALSLMMAVSVTFGAGQSLYGKYLTVADVEKATGLKGVTRKEVALTLEFYDAKNEKIVEARFDLPDFYKKEVDGNQKYYTPVPGIGQKAAYILGDTPYRLTFVKGKYCVMVQTPYQSAKIPGNKDFLINICKTIAGRL